MQLRTMDDTPDSFVVLQMEVGDGLEELLENDAYFPQVVRQLLPRGLPRREPERPSGYHSGRLGDDPEELVPFNVLHHKNQIRGVHVVCLRT